MILKSLIAGLGLITLCLSQAQAAPPSHPIPPDEVTPTLTMGAKVFNQHCVLCHGGVGMGEGILAVVLKEYPSTNLLENKYGKSLDSVRKSIIYGGLRADMHNAMPPWGDELVWVEVESVAMLVAEMYSDMNGVSKHLNEQRVEKTASVQQGKVLYENRCILCHGKNGDGKGKMAKIIKNPPPFNFHYSAVDENYMYKIVSKGGPELGRSPKMPAFGEELTPFEISSVILYVRNFKD